MANIPIYVPTFINAADYSPARVLPRIYFFNGVLECAPYYFEGYDNYANTESVFPYFDHYSVESGYEYPNSGSKSLLFNNESPAYGSIPDHNLYSEYWDTYVSLLYNPYTRLINAEAIIPLADYFKINLNDIVNFRGSYYHLRAINEYSLKTGECKIQLLGPIIPDALDNNNS